MFSNIVIYCSASRSGNVLPSPVAADSVYISATSPARIVPGSPVGCNNGRHCLVSFGSHTGPRRAVTMTLPVDHIPVVFHLLHVLIFQPHQRRLLVYSMYEISSASSEFRTHRLPFRTPALLVVLHIRTLWFLRKLPAGIHMVVHIKVYWHTDPAVAVVFFVGSAARMCRIVHPYCLLESCCSANRTP